MTCYEQTTRAMNICVALLLLAPMMLVCLPLVVLIRLESPGSPLFLQERVGRFQRPFTLVKLRTMAQDTEQLGSHEVSAAQLTRVGGFLRKTKLDELPQIWNVVKGDMNFVGPRPCLPNQVQLISERSKRGVFAVRPGITGLAQLEGLDMSTPIKLAEVDQKYVSARSLLGDMNMLLRTALGQGRGDALNSKNAD